MGGVRTSDDEHTAVSELISHSCARSTVTLRECHVGILQNENVLPKARKPSKFTQYYIFALGDVVYEPFHRVMIFEAVHSLSFRYGDERKFMSVCDGITALHGP